MVFRRVFYALAGLLVANVSVLWAGDSASFVNLGFSADGSVYMFAQYGVSSDTLRPWADVFVVDVDRNDFVPGGAVSYTHNRPIVAGQNGSAAMHALIARNAPLAERHGVTFPNQGQPLYIGMARYPRPGITARERDNANEPVEFRDFAAGISYVATLVETIEGTAANPRSSFSINLRSVDQRGETRTLTVGSPNVWRSGISQYRIRRVLVSPLGDSLVFVIEMRQVAGNTHNIRYMVETVRL